MLHEQSGEPRRFSTHDVLATTKSLETTLAMRPTDKKNVEEFFRTLINSVKPAGQVSWQDFCDRVSSYEKANLPSIAEIIDYLEKNNKAERKSGNIRFIKKITKKQNKPTPQTPQPKKQQKLPSISYTCKTCNTIFSDALEFNKHNEEHKRIEDEKDKNGVQIVPCPKEPFKLTYSPSWKKKLLVRFEIFDSKSREPYYNVYGMHHLLRITGDFQEDRLTVDFTYNRKLTVGYYKFVIDFIYDGFKISRFLDVDVADNVSGSLGPTRAYQKEKQKRTTDEISFIPGVPPNFGDGEQTEMLPLDKFPIPRFINTEFLEKESLNPQTHSRWFSTLLFLEEKQMQIDIQHYDLKKTSMKHNQQYLELKVPGLAEKRPSVLVGDFVVACNPEEDNNNEQSDNNNNDNKKKNTVNYQGFVHQVKQESVLLSFAPSFHKTYINGQPINIRFTFSRLPLRRMHNALLNMKTPSQFLFPNDPFNSQQQQCTVRPFNRDLNPEQLQAVNSILNLQSEAPYIIFGPPGTGKTVTVVEAILQLYKYKTTPILVCAPSNAAADIIVDRVCNVVQSTRELLRINAYSRDSITVPSKIEKYCYKNMSGHFGIPPLAELMKARIVVTTCISAGQLAMIPGIQDHFSHIFIDEAGHATEPEALVCLSGLCTVNTSIILAGDPKQLGPVIRSDLARTFGLEMSLLERLCINFSIYEPTDGVYNSNYITKLIRNYRSHPSLLELPSRLFYEGQLQPCANKVLVTKYCNWDELPTKGLPLIFDGVIGKDEREENSPSWFNTHEVAAVAKYIEKLLQSKIKTTQKDIGVIAPYRKQVEKLRKYFQQKDWKEIQVGSVEEFQGREKMVIIITTVRSSTKYIEDDYAHNLGFLKSPKRFNVAITRPQALLIVVGNPFVLSYDAHWYEMLLYSMEHGAYVGYPIDKEDLDHGSDDDDNNNNNSRAVPPRIKPSSVKKSFGEVAVIKKVNKSTGKVSQVTQQTDPEWSENR